MLMKLQINNYTSKSVRNENIDNMIEKAPANSLRRSGDHIKIECCNDRARKYVKVDNQPK